MRMNPAASEPEHEDLLLSSALRVYLPIICYLGCLKGVSKSVQVLFNGIEAVMLLILIIPK